jgi:hypothetical protein
LTNIRPAYVDVPDQRPLATPRKPRRRAWAVCLSTALILSVVLTVVAQQVVVTPQFEPWWGLAYLAGLGLLLLLDRLVPGSRSYPSPAWTGDTKRDAIRLPLLGGASICGVVVWVLMRGRDPSADYTMVAAFWMVSMSLLMMGVAPSWRGRVRPPARPAEGTLNRWLHRPVWVAAALILVYAALIRLVALDRYPFVLSGDEGAQLMSAVMVAEGALKNPFGTGWFSVPTLFFYLQYWSLMFFGDSVGGGRVMTALVGTLSVLFTFLLVKRLHGWPTALVATSLLASFHFHLHFSRTSTNQIFDALLLVLLLYLLDRALDEKRAWLAALVGLALGLCQYFYFGGRIIPLIAALYVAFCFIRSLRAAVPKLRRQVAATYLQIVGLTCLGFLLCVAPLAAYYADNPDELNWRFNQVSFFNPEAQYESLDLQMRLTGSSAPEVIAQQVFRAALLPIFTVPFPMVYFPPPPLAGEGMAVLVAIGFALAMAHVIRPQYFVLVASFWVIVLGLAMTNGPSQAQRFVVAAPLIAIFAAVGLIRLGTLSMALIPARVSRQLVSAVTVLVVLAITVWNVEYFFFAPHQELRYGGNSTLSATVLAYYLRDRGSPDTVYFLGPPRMYYYGFQNIPFIARAPSGIDLVDRVGPNTPRPEVIGPTVFAALPEREEELDQVRAWFPGGETRDLFSNEGEHLVTVYVLS